MSSRFGQCIIVYLLVVPINLANHIHVKAKQFRTGPMIVKFIEFTDMLHPILETSEEADNQRL